MNNSKNTYSIILPTFNEAGHIKKLILEIYEIFLLSNHLFEIIIIDDNSQDGTSEIVHEISKSNDKVILKVRKNKKGSLVESLNDGIQLSQYENLIWMDADFSHPPSYLEKIIFEKEQNDFDVMVFSRFLKSSERYYEKENSKPVFIDNLSSILNKICSIFLFKRFTDYTSGYICIKKEIFKNYKLKGFYGDYFMKLIVQCFLMNKKIIEFPYVELERFSGYSKTTSGNLNLLIKCFFYLLAVAQCFFNKIIK